MTNHRIKRIHREFNDLGKNTHPYLHIQPDYDNVDNTKIILYGPADTMYRNKEFHFTINFPMLYPFTYPEIKCITPVIHPNFYNGEICIDILSCEWSPGYTITTIFMAVYSLFIHPAINDMIYDYTKMRTMEHPVYMTHMHRQHKLFCIDYMKRWDRRRAMLIYLVGMGIWKNEKEGGENYPDVTKKNKNILKVFSNRCYLQDIFSYL